LVSPNIFIYIRLDSLKADNEQLTLNAAFDWYNGSSDQLSSPSHSVFFEDDPHLSSIAETTILNPSSPTSSDLSNKIEFDSPQDPDSSLEQETKGFGVEEKMHLWVEDRLMNELLQQFRWDFKWIDEVFVDYHLIYEYILGFSDFNLVTPRFYYYFLLFYNI
jgi:hypothetical protein